MTVALGSCTCTYGFIIASRVGYNGGEVSERGAALQPHLEHYLFITFDDISPRPLAAACRTLSSAVVMKAYSP